MEEELAQREFVPVILRIVNTPALTEPSSWRVETDRGPHDLEVESETPYTGGRRARSRL
ncbi:MAG: DUF1854 domain-containing protein [Bryobacterales bacterium]|nr:DUF1854 domain-containing protein [Bryobacterales bacterium]